VVANSRVVAWRSCRTGNTALRQCYPARNPTALRDRIGFDVYLEHYAAIYNTAGFRREAPALLLGRRALFDAPQKGGNRMDAAGCAD
jgi:hypothetical protein